MPEATCAIKSSSIDHLLRCLARTEVPQLLSQAAYIKQTGSLFVGVHIGLVLRRSTAISANRSTGCERLFVVGLHQFHRVDLFEKLALLFFVFFDKLIPRLNLF